MREGDARAGVRWPVVVETTALLAIYAAGMAIAWRVWPPLGLVYLAVILASNLLFMALVCPYCSHLETMSCHSGYHLVARFFPRREGKTFARQFQRNMAVMYPVWALPPLAGLYGLLRGLDWGLLALVLLFPPFEYFSAITKAALPTVEGFYFLFGDNSQRQLVTAILYIEVALVVINGALLGLLFKDKKLDEVSEEQARALALRIRATQKK